MIKGKLGKSLAGILGLGAVSLASCVVPLEGYQSGPARFTNKSGKVIGEGVVEGNFDKGLAEGMLRRVAYASLPYGEIELISRGNYSKGKPYGLHTMSDNFGSRIEGIMNENGGTMEGMWLTGKGPKYSGSWIFSLEKDIISGEGRIIYPDGRTYEGNWADHYPEDLDFRTVPHGKGVMKHPDGRIVEGFWELGVLKSN